MVKIIYLIGIIAIIVACMLTVNAKDIASKCEETESHDLFCSLDYKEDKSISSYWLDDEFKIKSEITMNIRDSSVEKFFREYPTFTLCASFVVKTNNFTSSPQYPRFGHFTYDTEDFSFAREIIIFDKTIGGSAQSSEIKFKLQLNMYAKAIEIKNIGYGRVKGSLKEKQWMEFHLDYRWIRFNHELPSVSED